MNKIINKNKILHTLGFFIVVVFSTSSGKTEAGEDATFKHQVYNNIAKSLLIKDENFPKGQYNIKNKEQSKDVEFINFTPTNQYTIKNKGQCKDSKEESFECAVLNLDKTIENRKKNNEHNFWIEVGCGYGFTDLPTKDLEKVVINNIKHYESDGSNYVRVNQDRYYNKIDRAYSLELTLEVTGQDGNMVYYPEHAIRVLNPWRPLKCETPVLDEHKNYKKHYRNIKKSSIKREIFNNGQYTIKNKGQCKDGKKESFECAVLNLDKTIENRKKNNGPNILWDENGCNYSFYNLPNKALKKVEITSIIHYEDTNYIGVNQGRYYKNIDREFSLELMLKVTGEGDNKAYYPEYAKRIGGITNSCKAVIVNN